MQEFALESLEAAVGQLKLTRKGKPIDNISQCKDFLSSSPSICKAYSIDPNSSLVWQYIVYLTGQYKLIIQI